MAQTSKTFVISGMHCPSCSKLIEMELGDLEGVSEATVDHRSGIAEVSYDDALVGPDVIADAVARAGYLVESAN
jgi:copper chaperone CopZ